MPMIVPAEGCGIKVGGETRQLEAGKVMVFDDTFWHEAWNDSDEMRIALLLDFWNPYIPHEDAAEIDRIVGRGGVIDLLIPLSQEIRKKEVEPRGHTMAGELPKAG